MQTLIEAADKFELKFDQRSKELSDLVCGVDCWKVEDFQPPETFDAIKTLWEQEPIIMDCFNRR
jgi:hypothetical protein